MLLGTEGRLLSDNIYLFLSVLPCRAEFRPCRSGLHSHTFVSVKIRRVIADRRTMTEQIEEGPCLARISVATNEQDDGQPK